MQGRNGGTCQLLAQRDNLDASEDAVEHVLLPSLCSRLPCPPPLAEQADDVPATVPACYVRLSACDLQCPSEFGPKAAKSTIARQSDAHGLLRSIKAFATSSSIPAWKSLVGPKM